MEIIDLHIHSTFSDGSYTPEEIMKRAAQVGIVALAITDHDTIAGVDEAAKAAWKYGIEFMPGMEITTQYKGRKLHIVALGFDRQCMAFRELYEEIRSVREARIGEIIGEIKKMGVDISLDKVKACTSGALDRYAIMRYLVTLRLENKAQVLWDKYINPAVKRLNLSIDMPAEKAVKAIHEAGGITSLAHFHKRIGLYGMTHDEQENVIAVLNGCGLDAMEAWYPTFEQEHRDFVSEMTAKYKLLNTGGTDFHGTNRPGIEIGTGIDNNMAIPCEVFYKIKAKIRQQDCFRRG